MLVPAKSTLGGSGSTTANALATTTTSVNVSNAAAPTEIGQVLEITSLSPPEATWIKDSPRRFNVKRHGVLGDGKEHYGTSINAASTTLTCTDGSFASTDIGKIIGVENAGAGGSWLITTIATYISATQVTLAAAAAYTVNSIATVAGEITTFYGTDDTVALQTCINNAFRTDSTHWNGNCEFFFPDSLYIIGGALQTAVTGFSSTAINYNSQIYIPNLPYKGQTTGNKPEFSFRCTMLFRGETRPHHTIINGIGTAQSPRSGARLRSTIQGSGTRPSVIAAKGGPAADNYYEINDNGVILEDLHIEITTDSSRKVTMCGANMGKAKYAVFNRVAVYPHNIIGHTLTAGAIAQPTTGTAGLITAFSGDEPGNLIDQCFAGGFDYAFMAGEHFQLRDSMCWVCNSALGVTSTTVPVYVDTLEANACKYVITYIGSIGDAYMPTNIATPIIAKISGECERTGYSGAWYEFVAAVNDPSSYLHGTVELALNQGYTGYAHELSSKIGAANVETKTIGNFAFLSTHTGTTYTFQYLYEAQQIHTFSNAAAITLIVPRGDTATFAGYCYNYDIGAEIKCIQGGVGQVTPTAAAGVTLKLPTGMTKSAGQNSEFTLRKIASNTWSVSGDLAP